MSKFGRALMRWAPLAGLAWSVANVAMAQADWPGIALPKGIAVFDVGQQVAVNSVPMRMRGFISGSPVTQLADWFRQSLGQPLQENTLGNQRILGRAQGDYYLTVQLEPIGKDGTGGTRGIAAVAYLKAVSENRAERQSTVERWLARLPPGSQLVSHMVSEDKGRRSTHLLIANGQSEEVNGERLTRILQEDGFTFERQAVADEKSAAHLPAHLTNGKTLYFKGRSKEAIAVLARGAHSEGLIVLNIVAVLEKFK